MAFRTLDDLDPRGKRVLLRADLNLPDTAVSRRHARITRLSGGFYLEDLKSSNGTFLDGTPVTAPTRLLSGARLQIGGTTFAIAIPGNAARPTLFRDERDSSTIIHILDAEARDFLATPAAADIKTLKRAKDDLAALYRVGQSISTILDTDELHAKILEILMGELKAVDYVSLHKIGRAHV